MDLGKNKIENRCSSGIRFFLYNGRPVGLNGVFISMKALKFSIFYPSCYSVRIPPVLSCWPPSPDTSMAFFSLTMTQLRMGAAWPSNRVRRCLLTYLRLEGKVFVLS